MRFLLSLNWPIFLSSFLLLCISVIIIFSSSVELATQQLFYSILGFVLYFLISRFDYRAIKNLILPLYFFTLALLIIVLILGIETRGSIRWIPIGFFNIQPSEFAKPVIILVLADFWSRNLTSWINIFKSLALTMPILLLVFRQPDLGTTLTILAIWIGILISTKISVKKVLAILLIFLLTVPLGWISLHDYQKQRIINFLSPSSDPLGTGYNIIQSTVAVGSGQIFGRGLGRGTQSRLQFLPEYRTDFIFASIAEELGFLGSLLILAIYFYLIIYCLNQVRYASDPFGFLIILGVVSMLIFQIAVNIGMNIGVVPITGITLPLVSYGGSSLISTLISLGLVSSVIKLRRNFLAD